jgi:hypothetical protein
MKTSADGELWSPLRMLFTCSSNPAAVYIPATGRVFVAFGNAGDASRWAGGAPRRSFGVRAGVSVKIIQTPGPYHISAVILHTKCNKGHRQSG